MKKQIFWWSIICAFGLMGLVLWILTSPIVNTVHAQAPESRALPYKAAAVDGEFLIVTNTSEEINGDLSSPTALIANPGPDGISLAEAILAAEATSEYDVIKFDPALSGSVIDIQTGIPVIGHGNLTIDGNIDDDATPDITLDGTNSATFDGIPINGASHVVIKGLTVRNFRKSGISISPDTANGAAIVEDIVLFQNTITTEMSTLQLMIWNQDHATIRDVEIISNTLQDSGGGISVIAGMGTTAMDNHISGVSIINNTIYNPGQNIGIFISPAASSGLSRNTISDVEIRGNHISGHLNATILIDASNQINCNDNTTDGVVIAENTLDGEYVTIEILSESGSYSTGNTTKNIAITDNVLTRGGIQFGSATGFNAHDNTISTVLIERNRISSCLANGIYMIAGSGGAYHNLLEKVTLRNNFIHDCADAGILLHGDTSSSPTTQSTSSPSPIRPWSTTETVGRAASTSTPRMPAIRSPG